MSIGWLGGFECLIILLIVLVVAGLAFRVGFSRGRDGRR
jgi:hypothetical protein